MTDPIDHTQELDELAAALEGAERTRRPIDQVSAGRPWLGPVEAYGIQERLVAARIAQGETLVGWKVGLTSVAMQQQLGVDQPDYGAILSGWVVADGAVLPIGRLHRAPCRGGDLLPPGASAARPGRHRRGRAGRHGVGLPRARDHRFAHPRLAADARGHHRGHGQLGAHRGRRGRACPSTGLDLRAVTVDMTRTARRSRRGVGAACLGDPAAAVAWAANTLGALGVTLEAGQIVMPGAFTPRPRSWPVSTFRGDRFAGLGSVGIRFCDRDAA